MSTLTSTPNTHARLAAAKSRARWAIASAATGQPLSTAVVNASALAFTTIKLPNAEHTRDIAGRLAPALEELLDAATHNT